VLYDFCGKKKDQEKEIPEWVDFGPPGPPRRGEKKGSTKGSDPREKRGGAVERVSAEAGQREKDGEVT